MTRISLLRVFATSWLQLIRGFSGNALRAVVACTLSAAAPALAQDLTEVRIVDSARARALDSARARVLLQESHRVIELKQRELERAIARIKEVEAETQRFREEKSASHGFSVILALGDLQGAAPTRDLPPAASKALADMSQFLPYKSYELIDARWILGSPRSTSVIRGPQDREYELELRTSPRSDSEVQIDFYLRDPRQARPFVQSRSFRTGNGTGTVRIVKQPGRIIDTTFNMDVGETVVVGTSRLQGDKALIVLLTAVGR